MSTKYMRGEDTPFIPQHARQKQSGGSRKTMFLLAGGGVILFLGVVLAVVLLSKKPSVGPVALPVSPTPAIVPLSTVTPTLSPSPSPLPARLTIRGVSVRDFTKDPSGTLPNGAYLLERNDDFQIVFDPKTNLFSITILNANFVRTRARAEERFLILLGVGEDEVCPLHVEIATPSTVNKAYAGLVFKFSTCE